MTFKEKVAKTFRLSTYTRSRLLRSLPPLAEKYRAWRRERLTEQTRRRRQRLTMENLRRGINEDTLKGIMALGDVKDRRDVFWTKYLDLDKWLAVNIRHAEELGLVDQPPRDVLDLGCGAGYFMLVCRALGARTVGLDVKNDQVFNQMIALFRLRRVTRRIRPFIKLPDFHRRFDLITGFMVCFNFPTNETYWGAKEWDFFLNDLLQYLKPGGRIFFTLNRQPDGELYTEEVKQYLLDRGAAINGKRVLLGHAGLTRTRNLPTAAAAI